MRKQDSNRRRTCPKLVRKKQSQSLNPGGQSRAWSLPHWGRPNFQSFLSGSHTVLTWVKCHPAVAPAPTWSPGLQSCLSLETQRFPQHLSPWGLYTILAASGNPTFLLHSINTCTWIILGMLTSQLVWPCKIAWIPIFSDRTPVTSGNKNSYEILDSSFCQCLLFQGDWNPSERLFIYPRLWELQLLVCYFLLLWMDIVQSWISEAGLEAKIIS